MGMQSRSDETSQWITCSLFAPMGTWPVLLEQIHYFLKATSSQFSFFRLQINDENGENLRLGLLSTSENKQGLADALNLRFKSVLSTLSTKGETKKVDSIFLPFPTYVIEFDLYQVQCDANSSNVYAFQQEISNLVIQVLLLEDVDLETITTFCFYLQISFVKAVLIRQIPKTELIELFSGFQYQDVNSIKTASDENMEILAQITKEVMNTEQFENELAWINRWMNFCEEAFKEHLNQYGAKNIAYKSQLESFHQFVVSHIYERLGISGKSKVFLDYTVSSSMIEYLRGINAFKEINYIA